MSSILTDVEWSVYGPANELLGVVMASDEDGAMDQAKAWFGAEAVSVQRKYE